MQEALKSNHKLTCYDSTFNKSEYVKISQERLFEAAENIDVAQLESLITEMNEDNVSTDQDLIFNYRYEEKNAVGRLLTKRIASLEQIKTLKTELEQKENFTILISQEQREQIKISRMTKIAEIAAQELILAKIKSFILKICSISYFNQEEATGFILNDKNLTTKDALFLYDFEAWIDRFWSAVTNLRFEQLTLLITEIENSHLSSQDQKLIFNSQRQDKNAIGFLVENHIHFFQEKESLKAELERQEASGMFTRRQDINSRNNKIAEIKYQDEMLLRIKECIFKIFNISLFNQEEAIGFVLDSRPVKAREALSAIYNLEDLEKKFWAAVENNSSQELVSLIEEIQTKNLSQDEQSLIFNSKKRDQSAVDYLFQKCQDERMPVKHHQEEIIRVTKIIEELENISFTISTKAWNSTFCYDTDQLIDYLNSSIAEFKHSQFFPSEQEIPLFAKIGISTLKKELYSVNIGYAMECASIEEELILSHNHINHGNYLHEQQLFWETVTSINIKALKSFTRTIKNKNLSSLEQMVIFNYRKNGINAIGSLILEHLRYTLEQNKLAAENNPEIEGITIKLKNIKNFILEICKISAFNQDVYIGIYIDHTFVSAREAVCSIYGLSNLYNKFWYAIENIDYAQLNALIREINSHNLSKGEIHFIFNSQKEGLNAVGCLVKKHLELENYIQTSRPKANTSYKRIMQIKNFILKICNMSIFNQENYIGLLYKKMSPHMSLGPSIKISPSHKNLIFNMPCDETCDSLLATSKNILHIYDLENLLEKFWNAIENISIEKLESLIIEINDKNLDNTDKDLIFNSRQRDANAVGVIVMKILNLSAHQESTTEKLQEIILKQIKLLENNDLEMMLKIKNFILRICQISNFDQSDYIGLELIPNFDISNSSRDILCSRNILHIYNLADLQTKFWSAITNLNPENLVSLIKEIIDKKIGYKDQILIFNSKKDDLNAFDSLAKKYQELEEINSTDKMLSKIRYFICIISQIAAFNTAGSIAASPNTPFIDILYSLYAYTPIKLYKKDKE